MSYSVVMMGSLCSATCTVSASVVLMVVIPWWSGVIIDRDDEPIRLRHHLRLVLIPVVLALLDRLVDRSLHAAVPRGLLMRSAVPDGLVQQRLRAEGIAEAIGRVDERERRQLLRNFVETADIHGHLITGVFEKRADTASSGAHLAP